MFRLYSVCSNLLGMVYGLTSFRMLYFHAVGKGFHFLVWCHRPIIWVGHMEPGTEEDLPAEFSAEVEKLAKAFADEPALQSVPSVRFIMRFCTPSLYA